MIAELTNGVRLNYEVMGSGPALLLLHGNGEDHHSFDALAPKLAEEYKVYGIDSRGQGKSSHQGEAVGYAEMAEDIDLFIQMEGLEDVSIMGHSDGAIIALLLGIQQKAYLNHLVLLSVTLNTTDITDEVKKLIQEMYEASGHDPLVELMLHEPNIPLADLKKVKVPTLVVCADHDVMAVEQYARVARELPLSQLYVLPGSNHINYVIGTDRIGDEVLYFLSQSPEHVQATQTGGVFGQNLDQGEE